MPQLRFQKIEIDRLGNEFGGAPFAGPLAALGQLTAGIAHEIKNPLNFVNNFAGLSVELLDELKAASNRR